MTVEVKKVGNYKIHVKETTIETNSWWQFIFSCVFVIIGGILLFTNVSQDGYHWISPSQNIYGVGISLLSIPALIFCIYNPFNWFIKPAYYVDTTMYGVGGETILKTTPEQDHIAICRAAQKFEKEILERIKREDELKEIVGTCK